MTNIDSFNVLVGSWRHSASWDSDDYLAEYIISIEADAVVVSAHDLQDGEEFIISEIKWNGHVLSFRSLMPSTGREGLNEFELSAQGVLKSRFTFTVVEELHRVGT